LSREHGDFAVGQAEIRLNVRVAPEIITVSYRDNSSLFVTNDPDFVDLQNKIEKGDRRGLGLFMLNKMARSLEY